MTGLDPPWWIAIGAGLGLIVGSFVATLVLRWPAGRSAARGRSMCDGCGRSLGAADLVPLVSYAVAGGRCRACGAAIHRLHPAVEIGCALIGALALAAAPGAAGLAGAAFGWALLALAMLDARHFWLPDALTLPLVVTGLLVGATGLAPSLGERAIGAAAGFAVLTAIGWTYKRIRGREGLGGGDPKLLAAIGAWLGWASLPLVLLVASGIGLGIAGFATAMGRRMGADSRLPLGTLLAIAAFPLWLLLAVAGFPEGGVIAAVQALPG